MLMRKQWHHPPRSATDKNTPSPAIRTGRPARKFEVAKRSRVFQSPLRWNDGAVRSC